MDVREKLVELVGQVQDCGCDVTDVVQMNYVENTTLVDHLIAHGVTVQEWIPVTERLPEKDDRFICTYKFNSNSEMQFVSVLYYYASDQYPHWQHESAGVIVTHWMPLPEPPKEG